MTAIVSSLRAARARGLRFPRSWSARIGLALSGFAFALALFGPFFSPHSPTGLAGPPLTPPSGDFLLGTDYLGRDVLSRVLSGGRALLGLAVLATFLGYLGGATIGLVAGYSRSLLDAVLMRAMDVLLAFPVVLFVLVLVAGAGRSVAVVVAGVAILHVPSIARIIRAATLDTCVRGYVEAAVARGEPTRRILFREILPNIAGTIAADGGPRLAISVLIVAGFNFLGVGIPPPAPDWGVMIDENRLAMAIQPWGVAVPALLIAALSIGVNLVADAVARSLGTSADRELIRR